MFLTYGILDLTIENKLPKRLLTEMAVFDLIIGLTATVVSTVDSLYGPYFFLLSSCNSGSASLIRDYFNCDLPLNFYQYLSLRQNIYACSYINKKNIFTKLNYFSIYSTYFLAIKNHYYFYNFSSFVNFINLYLNTPALKFVSNDIFSENILFNKYQDSVVTNIMFLNQMSFIKYYSYDDVFKKQAVLMNRWFLHTPSSNNTYYNWLTSPLTLITIPNNFIFNYVHTKINAIVEKNPTIGATFFVNFFTIYIFFMFFHHFFVNMVKKLTYRTFLRQRIFKEHDQESASFEDFIVFIVFFFAFFIGNLNTETVGSLVDYSTNSITWFLFFMFFTLVVFTPLSIFSIIGSSCFIYIKGTDKHNSFLSLVLFDTINTLAFILRFALQLIRWSLFITTYYLLHEFVFELAYGLFIDVFKHMFSFFDLTYTSNLDIIATSLAQIIRFLFELVDTCLILIIQVTAFIAVILWLFNYLFSISIENIFEELFSNNDNKC